MGICLHSLCLDFFFPAGWSVLQTQCCAHCRRWYAEGCTHTVSSSCFFWLRHSSPRLSICGTQQISVLRVFFCQTIEVSVTDLACIGMLFDHATWSCLKLLHCSSVHPPHALLAGHLLLLAEGCVLNGLLRQGSLFHTDWAASPNYT